MTEIEIRDPDTAAPEATPAPDSPYKNLLVPLVVVPALIVMVLVLIFVLFVAVTGEESTPRENLDRLLNGGYNERKQAAFNLVRQVLDHRRNEAQGKNESAWVDASFLPELRAARERVDELRGPRDVPIPLVLSSLLAQLGEAEGVAQLAEMTQLGDELDPEREYRMYAAMTLGAIGRELPPPVREQAARALIALLENADAVLVLVAIAGLQNLPCPETVPALRGMLKSRSLEQRASAALSLSVLGERSGEPVLREMLDPAVYEAERTADPRRWPPQRVSESRCKALDALIALGIPPAPEELRRMESAEADPKLQQAAARLLRDGASQ